MDSRRYPSKNNKVHRIPIPRDAGWFMLLIIAMAFTGGILRKELVLILVGAVFAGAVAYSFFGIIILAFLHRKKCMLVSAQPSPVMIESGQAVSFSFSRNGAGRFFRFPGICIRYEMALVTKDGRKWLHRFDPDQRPDFGHSKKDSLNKDDYLPQEDSLPQAAERGAYYGETDSILVFDILGFFKKSLVVPLNISVPRLLATPSPAEETFYLPVKAGGRENRTEPNFVRTDDLIDHRPYIPGDDPRRINWKLYGHVRDLFVREGEPEPPPKSELVIILDTSVDARLYKREAALRAVDALCAHALAMASEYARQGREIRIGYSGLSTGGLSTSGYSAGSLLVARNRLKGGDSRELATYQSAVCQPAVYQPAAIQPATYPQAETSAGARMGQDRRTAGSPQEILAYPAAVFRPAAIYQPATGKPVAYEPEKLPQLGENQGAAVFALPRIPGEGDILEEFLHRRNSKQRIELCFLYTEGNEKQREAAEVCVRLYNNKGGIHAQCAQYGKA